MFVRVLDTPLSIKLWLTFSEIKKLRMDFLELRPPNSLGGKDDNQLLKTLLSEPLFYVFDP